MLESIGNSDLFHNAYFCCCSMFGVGGEGEKQTKSKRIVKESIQN